MKLFNVVILLMTIFFTSCATVLSGSTDSVHFDSEPRGAEVIIDGDVMGVTPLTLELKRRKFKNVEVSLEGYQTQSRPLEKSFDSVAALNIFWDLSTTDLITGNAFKYDPGSYHFRLEKE